jgi:hypothetical protein
MRKPVSGGGGVGAIALLLPILNACSLVSPRGGVPQVPAELPAAVRQLDEKQVNERLDFLIERLDHRRDWAWYWQNGWTVFYGLGIVIQGTRAGLTDHEGKKADFSVSAVKAVGGTANLLLRPIQAQDGADRVRELPSATLEDRRRQLVLAEEQLRINAEEAKNRWHWVRHALNVAVNAAGAVIVWKGFDDTTRAWRSFGVGTAVGEAMILSAPWWPEDDWDDYQRRFGPTATEPEVSWRLVPTLGGAQLEIAF